VGRSRATSYSIDVGFASKSGGVGVRVLVYKRTHVGDPDARGRFGIDDCMGQDRSWHYDAVVGVGGLGAQPRWHHIARKVTWIGIGPHKTEVVGKRGPLVTFDRFRLFDDMGPSFDDLAPTLAKRIYERRIRATIVNCGGPMCAAAGRPCAIGQSCNVDGSDPEVSRLLRLLDLAASPSAASGAREAPAQQLTPDVRCHPGLPRRKPLKEGGCR